MLFIFVISQGEIYRWLLTLLDISFYKETSKHFEGVVIAKELPSERGKNRSDISKQRKIAKTMWLNLCYTALVRVHKYTLLSLTSFHSVTSQGLAWRLDGYLECGGWRHLV